MLRLSAFFPVPVWRGVWLVLLGLLPLAAALAHPPGQRLEPGERARLRQEMRQQAWGMRGVEPHGVPGPGVVAPSPMVVTVPGSVPGPGLGPSPLMPPAQPGGPGQPPFVPALRVPPNGPLSEPGSPLRLTPEERRQLRMQMLEERQRRREALQLPMPSHSPAPGVHWRPGDVPQATGAAPQTSGAVPQSGTP